MKTHKTLRSVPIFGAAVAFLCLTNVARPQASVALSRVQTTPLRLSIARVDQVVLLPNGGFAIRSSDFRNEQNQAIQILDPKGQYVRRIGSFGRGPGQYFRLTSIGVQKSGVLWATDLRSRLMTFDEAGNLLRTFLIQAPGYDVKDLSFDEQRGMFYLTGCLPTKTYLDLGCQLIHEYAIQERRYLRSFLETDPEAISKRLLPLENYHIDVDRTGRIFFIDAALFKLFVIDPESGRSKTFPISSKAASPPKTLDAGQSAGYYDSAYESASLLDTLQVLEASAVVSIRKPHNSGYILEVFCVNGSQVATDLQPPGKLVGKGLGGTLYFEREGVGGIELEEFRLESACAHSGK